MEKWITTWAQAHGDMRLLCEKRKDYTVKSTIYSCLSGNQVRLRLSNHEGTECVHILEIGIQAGNGDIIPVTVAGESAITLSPKQTVYSDIIPMLISEGMDITVSMAFRGSATSGNQLPEVVRCSSKGRYAMARQMQSAKKGIWERLFSIPDVIPVLSSVEIMTQQEKDVIVCFGDSITQQSYWTKPLGQMLPNTVVINKGIGGNQLLSDPVSKYSSMAGCAGKNRFHIDVLEETGVTGVIFALGTNDIGLATDQTYLAQRSAEKLMECLLELNRQAKKAGLKTYIATLTPRWGSKGYQYWHEAERCKLNELIRQSTGFDGIIDFDAVTRDKVEPSMFDEPCDSGDHLHPGAVGGMRMAREAYRVLSATVGN